MASELGVQTIQHTNGTDAMTLDSSGRVLTPTRPAFSVSLTSSSTAGYQNVLNFDTVHTNVGSHYDTTNNRFVAPIAGLYHFAFSSLGCGTTGGGVLPVATGNAARIELSTNNGSSYTAFAQGYSYFASSTSYPNLNCTGTIELAAGNYVHLNIFSAFAYVDASGDYNPRFSGFLIG